MDKKLILFELNEVPYRVIDAYTRAHPHSNLARLLPLSDQYQTTTEDRLALDPWISWPTLHRGVNDEVHNILHLGQVLEETNAKYPPVWQMLHNKGLSVGVFGSLHSSTVPADARKYSFYLPDYFDNAVFAHPASLEPFQILNLAMTRESARNVSRSIPLAKAAKFAAAAPFLGLKLSTIGDSLMHLVRESQDRSLRIRRRVYQPLVMLDLFLGQLRATRPRFATFYTNHVAAAMHRYWGAAFPEDYGDQRLDDEWIRQYRGEIDFAMDKFDSMLGHLVSFVDRNKEYSIIVASSMGQAAIPATKTHSFLTITDVGKFMGALGVPPGAWEARPAMVPCCCVVVNEQYRDAVVNGIQTLKIGDTVIKQDKRPTGPMSYDERHRGFFQFFIQFDNYSGPPTASLLGKNVPLADSGFGDMAHEDGINCTAQHVPGGSLFVYSPNATGKAKAAREQISTLDVVPSILKFFGFERESYMRGAPAINLS